MIADVAHLVLHGIGISRGKASAPLHFYTAHDTTASQAPTSALPEEEWARLSRAIEHVQKDLEQLYEQASGETDPTVAEIFRIHGMLLSDEDLMGSLRESIARGSAAEEALESSIKTYVALFSSMEDPYLSERARDLEDLSAQIRAKLADADKPERTLPETPYILVAEDLSPSQTVRLNKQWISGFVTFRGSPGSHTAILARAMGIPALVGVGPIDPAYDGTHALLDAAAGELILGAEPTECQRFEATQAAEDRIAREHEAYLLSLINKPALTRAGRRVLIYSNLGEASEIDAALAQGAEGIGLLRSEFLYLAQQSAPSEEMLFSAYSEVVRRMQGRRTVIRTLDVGADKQIPYFDLPAEENPALGLRAIRLCLARPELFCTQLRAILRASALGPVSLMLPMIVSVDEVRQSRAWIDLCKQELDGRGIAYDRRLEIGIMIETPAAALMSEELAEEVDFFSVRTNDLLQYTLAADRQDSRLAPLCSSNHEPVLRLIGMAANAIHRTGGWIGICGELAADLRLTQRFVSLGVDELSVAPPYLLGVRERIGECL